MRKFHKKIKGTSLIEFSLVFPIYLIILMGIIDYSIVFYDRAIISNASLRSARYGIIKREPSYATSDQVTTYAKNATLPYLLTFATGGKSVEVNVTASTPPQSGAPLTVTLNFQYTRLSFFKYLGLPLVETLSSTSTMIYE